MIIEIGDKVVSADIFKEEFVCDLNSCKGICCVEGDDGAPLSAEEVEILNQEYEKIKPYLTEKGIEAIEKKGAHYLDRFNEPVTQLIDNKECVYVTYDEKGWAQCGIEQAYKDGVTDFKKPISCHLYPIRVKNFDSFKALNYDRWDICSCACDLGKELKVKVYQFLKEPLIREFGEEFYHELELVNFELEKHQISDNG